MGTWNGEGRESSVIVELSEPRLVVRHFLLCVVVLIVNWILPVTMWGGENSNLAGIYSGDGHAWNIGVSARRKTVSNTRVCYEC